MSYGTSSNVSNLPSAPVESCLAAYLDRRCSVSERRSSSNREQASDRSTSPSAIPSSSHTYSALGSSFLRACVSGRLDGSDETRVEQTRTMGRTLQESPREREAFVMKYQRSRGARHAVSRLCSGTSSMCVSIPSLGSSRSQLPCPGRPLVRSGLPFAALQFTLGPSQHTISGPAPVLLLRADLRSPGPVNPSGGRRGLGSPGLRRNPLGVAQQQQQQLTMPHPPVEPGASATPAPAPSGPAHQMVPGSSNPSGWSASSAPQQQWDRLDLQGEAVPTELPLLPHAYDRARDPPREPGTWKVVIHTIGWRFANDELNIYLRNVPGLSGRLWRPGYVIRNDHSGPVFADFDLHISLSDPKSPCFMPHDPDADRRDPREMTYRRRAELNRKHDGSCAFLMEEMMEEHPEAFRALPREFLRQLQAGGLRAAKARAVAQGSVYFPEWIKKAIAEDVARGQLKKGSSP